MPWCYTTARNWNSGNNLHEPASRFCSIASRKTALGHPDCSPMRSWAESPVTPGLDSEPRLGAGNTSVVFSTAQSVVRCHTARWHSSQQSVGRNSSPCLILGGWKAQEFLYSTDVSEHLLCGDAVLGGAQEDGATQEPLAITMKFQQPDYPGENRAQWCLLWLFSGECQHLLDVSKCFLTKQQILQWTMAQENPCDLPLSPTPLNFVPLQLLGTS